MASKNDLVCVYIHVPFCLRKCGYCDFFSVTNLDKKQEYLSCLLNEISRKANGQQIPIKTLFFGGGTPTLLTIEDYTQILKKFDLNECEEFTIEANPDTVTLELLEGLKNFGLTRVSIGMQSSCSKVLKRLDRTHCLENVERSINISKGLGLDTSLDLIYGTPFETIEEWEQSVKDSILLNPDHISCYALTLEPNVPMYKVNKQLIDEDEQADKYFIADTLLENAGYSFYEISNWSKPNKECKHNLNYWKRGTYFGFGPSAHSFEKGKQQIRYSNSCSIPWEENFRETLNKQDIELEEKMMKLRLKNGVKRDQRMIIDSLI